MTPDIGDIGLVGQHGLADGLIGLFERSPARHAFILSRIDPDGALWIVEAQPGGAVETKLHYDNVVWLPFPGVPTGRSRVAAQARAIAARHVGYGFLDIAAIAVACILPLRWRPLQSLLCWAYGQIQRGDRLICSQLCAICWQRGGVMPWPIAAAVTPATLLDFRDGFR